MRKLIILFIILIGLIIPSIAFANSELETESIIQLVLPEDNQTVNGFQDVRWIITTEEAISSTRIFVQKSKCSEDGEYYGDVFSQEKPSRNSFKIVWNTSNPLLNNISLEDGEYCLVANAVLGEDGTRSIEDQLTIKVNNKLNRSPKILNNVSTLFFKPTSQFNLDIDASDQDGDKLKYSLERQIDFLKINQNTGVISNTTKLQEGIHLINVLVEDGNGGTDRISIILNVSKISDSFESSLTINSPLEYSIEDSKGFNIEWTWNSDPKKIKLQYSDDGRVWSVINDISSTFSSFEWQPDDLRGEFYLRFIALDDSGATQY